MNIRFLAQFEYFNAVHLKDDIILEKEYEAGPFENIPKVRYYLYFLEENVRKEVAPHSDKVDIFEITNCVHHSDFIYFTGEKVYSLAAAPCCCINESISVRTRICIFLFLKR